jgi:phage shock protein PspC (stress-responsive transcriptional regulator)
MVDNGIMSNPVFSSSRRTAPFRRLGGPLGGVAAGVANTFGVSTALVRLGLVLATLIFGVPIVVAYVALWYLLPVDRSVPVDQRPDRPPLMLVIILALIIGLGAVFDLAFGLISLFFSLVPVTLLVVGAVLLFLMLRRSGRRDRAAW